MTAVTHTRLHTGSGEDFGPRADGMVTFHTFEQSDPSKNTIRDAIAGAIWQDRQDVAGSYGRIVAVDGVLLTVLDHHASGGINPGSASWAPKAWLYQHFSREEIANPNYFTLNVCAMTRRAHSDKYGWDPRMIDGLARCWIDEERRIGRKIVPNDHSDFQSNRSDIGPIAMGLIKQRYLELTSSVGDNVADIDVHQIERCVVDANAAVRSAPSPDSEVLGLTTQKWNIITIGTKNGYHAYWDHGRKRWVYTDTAANILEREPGNVLTAAQKAVIRAEGIRDAAASAAATK